MKNRLVSLILAVLFTIGLMSCTSNPPAPTDIPTDTPTAPAQTPAITAAPASTPTSAPAPTETPEAPVTVRVAALKGPTAIGMVKLISDSAKGETEGSYEFTLAGSPDEITGSIVTGDFDIACVATNLAANLYQKTSAKIQLAALNTMGVLYVVETGDTIHSAADLAGKTIWSSGKGSTPEYALNYILERNGITDASVEYATEHSELAAKLNTGDAQVAVLPQPFVTTVLMSNENLRVALNLTDEWEAVSENDGGLTMGCIIVQKKFAQEHPQAFKKFMEEYGESIAFVTDPANISEAAGMVVEQGIIPKQPVAEKAIPECAIVFVTGDEMKAKAKGFFEVLYNANPKSIGGQMPDDDLYLTVY